MSIWQQHGQMPLTMVMPLCKGSISVVYNHKCSRDVEAEVKPLCMFLWRGTGLMVIDWLFVNVWLAWVWQCCQNQIVEPLMSVFRQGQTDTQMQKTERSLTIVSLLAQSRRWWWLLLSVVILLNATPYPTSVCESQNSLRCVRGSLISPGWWGEHLFSHDMAHFLPPPLTSWVQPVCPWQTCHVTETGELCAYPRRTTHKTHMRVLPQWWGGVGDSCCLFLYNSKCHTAGWWTLDCYDDHVRSGVDLSNHHVQHKKEWMIACLA